MKKLLLLLMVAWLPITAYCDDVKVGELWYSLNSDFTATVVSSSDDEYFGDIVIPESIKIKQGDVDLKYTVTSINDNAFTNCNSLTSVIIPNSITAIRGHSAYYYRESYINSCGAFMGCDNLTSVSIGNNVTYIGDYAFANCNSLTSITIPNSVETIGCRAFGSCSNLTSVSIGNGVNKIGQEAFYACGNLDKVNISDIAAWCKIQFVYDNSGYNVATDNVPSNPLRSAHNLYLNEEELTDLIIPEGVTEINKYAFLYCSSLKSVTLSEGLTSIGVSAFFGCSNLTSITIPSSVSNISNIAINGCSRLTSVTVLAKEPIFEDESGIRDFSNKANATLYVPKGSKAAYGAADNWKGFKEIQEIDDESSGLKDGDTFKALTPEGVEMTFKVISEADKTCQVGTGEYSDVTIDKSYAGHLTIPTTANGYKVTTIASWAFYNYSNLTGITISEGIEQLMSNCIEQCNNINSFVLPASVTYLDSAFGSVGTGLQTLSVSDGNTVYDSRDNCNAIIETETNTLVCGCNITKIPGSVTAIGRWSMTYYNNESITIPEQITSIGDGAFRGSSFKEIIIPVNVKEIGWSTFESCHQLEKVTILSSECNIDNGAFYNNSSLKEVICHIVQPQAATANIFTNLNDDINDDLTLYVPYDTKSLYEQTEGWNNVKNVMEFNVAGSSLLSIEDFKMITGKAKAMLLDVVNPAQAVTSVEFDLTLPEGLTIVANDGKLDVEIAGRTTAENHSLEATVNGGNVHIKVYSANKNVISGTNGALLRFNLTAGNFFTGGNITLSNQVLTSPDGTKSEPEDLVYAVSAEEEVIINFADENVKAICIEKWDTDGDGELSTAEAAAVTSLGEVFTWKSSISTFDELKYFTGLTSIGFNAFHGSGIKSVTLPSTITEIGMCAFSESFLESITLPNGLISIGYEAFTDCCLTSIVIPASVTMFGTNAFQYCGLKEVTSLITNPKSIGEDVFTCYSTAVLKVPEGTRIAYRNANGWNKFMYTAESGEDLFFEVDGITYGKIYDEYGDASVCLKDGKSASGDYRIPSSVECDKDGKSYSVTAIGDGAFAGSAITSLCLYDDEDYYYNYSVKTFGDGVFRNCASLKTVTFSPNVTGIGYNLFEGCNALEWVMSMVKEPAAVTWGEYAFYGWPGYTLYVPFGTTALYKEAGWAPMDNNIIVEGHDSEKFTAANADGVEMTFQIIRAAEKTCKVVKKYVDDDTFVSEAPESVTLPAEVKGFKVTAIDYEAFQFSSVKNVIIPEGVTRIGTFAFAENHLTSITIPKSMTEISSAFRGCKELTTVNISDLTAWCNIKFEGSNGLGHLYLNGEEVKDLVVPDGVTSLGENMALSSPFAGCASLTSVTIPASVTMMYEPFSGCSNLKSIVVDESNTVYDSRNNCNAIIETETGKLIAGCDNTIIPEGTTYIADGVFSGCTGLTSVIIPEGVTYIGYSTFSGCSNMTSLVIPSSVTYIGYWTFDGCIGLTSVTAFAEEPVTIYSEFPNAANATLYVPKGSKSAYEAADYWKEFKEIVEFSLGDANGDGDVDQKDVDAVAEYIMSGNAEGLNLINATGSDKKVLNVADIVRIINIMKNK